MITIEGTRYISAKTYADIHKLSPSRVSQMKAGLPFQYFEEINMDLINFDLLELSEEARSAAEQKIATRETLPAYTAGQLGNYFIALITRLTTQAAMADQLRTEAEIGLRQAQQTLQHNQDDFTRVQTVLDKTLGKLEETQLAFDRAGQEWETKLEIAATRLLNLQEQLKTLTTEKSGLEIALKTLETILERHTPLDGNRAKPATVENKKEAKQRKKSL